MEREFIYERRQTAGRMEAVMLVVSVVASIGAIFALFRHGWLPSLGLLVLGSVAFALSRLFALLGDLFNSICRPDDGTKPPASERAQNEI